MWREDDFGFRGSCGEFERYIADGFDVLGDVVACGAVAAGGGVFESAVFVVERDGDAIDFGFEGDGDVFATEVFLEALVESDEFGFGDLRVFEFEHIIDAQHRDRVGDLGKAIQWFGTDALGGRVGIGEVGVFFFQILQLAEKLVVFGVGYFRGGLGVVKLVVVIDELTQFGDAFFWRGGEGEKVRLVGHAVMKLQTLNSKFQGRVGGETEEGETQDWSW